VPDGVRLGIVRETYRATDGRERVAFVLAPPTGGTTATPGGEALPRAGGPSPARPLLILADPGGDASGIVSRYGDAALRHGWILASTPAVYNGTPDDADARELDALFAFVTSRHAIDRRRVVAGGFSGTGCTAYHEALLRPDRYRGAIAENAHTGYWDSMGSTVRPGGQSFYLFTRNADFNREPSRALLRGLVAAGFDAVLVEAAGDHQPMSPADADKALAWFERRWDGRCPHVAEPPVR
jgi:predicted esterase